MASTSLAYKSSLRISSLSKSVASVSRVFESASQTAGTIASTISDQNEVKRKSISSRTKYFLARREAVRRREQESIIEASSLGGVVKRTGKVVAESTKGFLGRILDFVGTLMVGWLLLNLPRIIDGAKKLIERMQKLVNTLSSAVGNVTDFLFTFGQLLGGIAIDIASFNFGNLSNTIGDAMNKMNESVRKLEQDVYDGINLLSTPIDFGFDGVIDQIEASGSPPSAGSSTEVTGVGANPTSLNEGARLLMQKGFPMKAAAYLAGNIQTESQWQAKRKPWILNDGAGTNKGLISWNRGRIAAAEKFLGKPLETANASEQIDWIKHEMSIPYYNSGPDGVYKVFMNPNSTEEQLKAASKRYIVWGELGGRWGHAQKAYQYLLKQGNVAPRGPVKLGGRLKSGQDVSGMIAPGGGVRVTISDTFGYSAWRKRNHGGIDISAPAGTYIALKVDCEVVFAGWQDPRNKKKGYGLVIDVWVPSYGVQLRFGHCSKFLITSGKIPAGRSFAVVGSTGFSTGPHIHFEYTKTYNKSGYGSDGDPSPYVPLILLTSSINYSGNIVSSSKVSAAQISVMNNNSVAQNITTERQGEEVVVIRRQSQGQPVSPASIIATGSQMILGGGQLNTFIKDVLFLNLANS